MSDVLPATIEQTREQARERLLLSLQHLGIEPTDPLGLVLLQVLESASVAAASMREGTLAINEAQRRHQAELDVVRGELATGRQEMDRLLQAGAQRIQLEEKLAENERAAAIDRIVTGITADLKTAVFDKLRQELPLRERDFHWISQFRGWSVVIGATAAVLLLGAVAGASINWSASRSMAFCQAHRQVDPHDHAAWCLLSKPDLTRSGSQPAS